ncbi:hypothetical protein ACH35V_21210 [Actinomadura sp. 1N219]|uniref:hypothetical protein n=1 Tax=Actinomadura sp. 1N219 TaxID=3375152 RepID=UPI00379E1841
MNPSRDLLCPRVEIIEFRRDLGEFREKDLTLFLSQPDRLLPGHRIPRPRNASD